MPLEALYFISKPSMNWHFHSDKCDLNWSYHQEMLKFEKILFRPL